MHAAAENLENRKRKMEKEKRKSAFGAEY